MPPVGDGTTRIRQDSPAKPGPEARAAEPGGRPEDRTGSDSAAANGLWDVAAAAEYLRLPIGSIYKMTAKKAAVRIPHIRLGGRLRFRRSDIEQWLTLLTISNLNTLTQMREKVLKVTSGDNSPTSP